MKKKGILIKVLMILPLLICIIPMTKISAQELDEDTNDSTKESENYEEFNDEGLIPDSEDNGRESWLSGINPFLRNFESSYLRGATIEVLSKDGKVVYDATDVYAQGWPDYSAQYYVPSLGKRLTKNDYDSAHEISTYTECNFTTTRTLNGYNRSWDSPVFDTGVDIPAGTYRTNRQAIDMVEIIYNGQKYWVSPQFNGGGYSSTSYGQFTDSKKTLSVNSVNGVPIHEKMMPVLEGHRTGFAMNVRYITIHNTANTGSGANALSHANLQLSNREQVISWHYTVDNTQIYQSMPMNEVGWHAGDGLLAGNASTIGVEICENADGNYAQAEKNAAYLAAQLLYENGLPADAIRLHKDWSGKNCAHNIIEGTKGSMGWNAFKALVQQEYDRIVMANSVDVNMPEEFTPVISNNDFKFDKGYVTGFEFNTTLQNSINKMIAVDPTITATVTKSGSPVGLDSNLATGQLVTLQKDDKTFKFMVVIKGDTNGDGQILANDYFIIKKYKESAYSLTGAYMKASDVNGDGQVLANDYFMIKKYKEGAFSIQQ